MSKSQELLQQAFDAIIKQERKLDDVAGGILDAIKTARASTIEKFDAMVYAVYDDNGWNYAVGRPAAGVEIVKVPQIIRVYVSTIRAAYLLGVPVAACSSLYELRQALQANRKPLSHHAANDDEYGDATAVVGVKISKPDKFIGESVHDLAVVFAHLPEPMRALLEKSINRLVDRYRQTVEESLAAA